MLATLHCIVFALGQFPDSEPQALPWVLIHKNADRIVGYVDDDWQDEEMVQVEIDEPWNQPGSDLKKGGRHISRLDRDESYRETRHDWRKRHLEGWEQEGYTNLGTVDDMFFVSHEESQWAERAAKIVEASTIEKSGDQEGPDSQLQAIDSGAPAGATRPSFIRAWGPHILILIVAGGLAALVVFTLLLK